MEQPQEKQNSKRIRKESECYSLILSLSHLCFAFPMTLFSKEEEKASFLFKKEAAPNLDSWRDWIEVFKYTSAYRIQSVILGEEKEPVSFSVRLSNKTLRENDILLEFDLLNGLQV